MKIERFNFQPLMTERDRWAELVSNSEGSFCLYHQVVELEAKCVELESKCAELLEACKGLLGIAERHGWLHIHVNAARTAIAKAEGGQP